MPDYLHLFEIGQPRLLNKRLKSPVKAKVGNISESQLLNLVPLRDVGESSALAQRKNSLSEVRSVQDMLNLYRSKG